MIQFVNPEAFLLLPLAALVLRRQLWPRPLVGCLRVGVLTALVALLAQPFLAGSEKGRDIVMLLDRSRSMPATAATDASEFAVEVAERLLPGDRLALVGFGRTAQLEAPLTGAFAWPPQMRTFDGDASDLAEAIDAGLLLIPPGRRGSLLLVSDGEATGRPPEEAARVALAAGVRIDGMAVPRAIGADVAVEDLSGPGSVELGVPFVLNAFVVADRARPASWRLLRDGQLLDEGPIDLRQGRNTLQFAQQLDRPGVQLYSLEVSAEGDPVANNDRGMVAVRASAPPTILCVTPGGREDRLTRSLQAAGHRVTVTSPESAPLRLDALDSVRCVVLEDVPAQDLPSGSLAVLGSFVRDFGGGLLMTGGPASYGVGGYHLSAVEDVLPVTMEIREEQRRFALAMAIALDTSGSMGMDAGGQTKMDLANRGAAAAVELLSKIDAVSVIAVDSAPTVVLEMQRVEDPERLSNRIRMIRPGGGGIYVDAALDACARELSVAVQGRRHMVLFADAADAEQPGDYRQFVPQLVAGGITVSVIGLGSKTDSDAELLREIAALGQGRCQFVAQASDLPRVFAQETIQVARAAMVEESTASEPLPALRLLGGMPGAFPVVDGYSLAWPRPEAELALVTSDENQAPMLSYWHCGLGRSAALLAEADGELSGGLRDYSGYAEFFGTLARWLSGGAQAGVWVDFSRRGDLGQLEVEVDAAVAPLLDDVVATVIGPDGSANAVQLQRTEPTRLVATVPLLAEGVYRAAVQVGESVIRSPPVCLPYSPEFAPRLDPQDGARTLRRLVEMTAGNFDPSADQVVAGQRESVGRNDLGAILAWLAVLLLLLEIAARRLGWQLPALSRFLRRRAVGRSVPAGANGQASDQPAASGVGGSTRGAAGSDTRPSAPASPAETVDSTLQAMQRARQRRDGGAGS